MKRWVPGERGERGVSVAMLVCSLLMEVHEHARPVGGAEWSGKVLRDRGGVPGRLCGVMRGKRKCAVV